MKDNDRAPLSLLRLEHRGRAQDDLNQKPPCQIDLNLLHKQYRDMSIITRIAKLRKVGKSEF